ncbi:hypothetical protein M409DRAFT_18496 [Zasmidium cellare ATCC 36951]|uniref:F-box domain-containing protein n=1 Tax=Zasmidium cellare ATCC 36951 TaxID=1080233 RepID=A0A6A6CYV9_ZASCE|nr:uncharacterized protein M409DRAFT_18496 [Zasmidium cellare ATCC 36951]KAF2171380.1 hypothetical protein M409DRAFT_18496 [Zasmidium cellare ATCC 36951]
MENTATLSRFRGVRALRQPIEQDPRDVRDDPDRTLKLCRYVNYVNPRAFPVFESRPYNPAPMPDGRSLLLELPGEIRNLVYELVATSGAEVHTKRFRSIMSRSRLVGVNRQIRQEYRSLLTMVTSPIIFKVVDFNFDHAVRFLNGLSDIDLKALPKIHTRSQREVRIFLTVTRRCSKNAHELHFWLNRAGHDGEKGYNVKVKYTMNFFDRPDDDHPLPQGLRHAESQQEAHRVLVGLQTGSLRQLDSDRAREEAIRIKKALARNIFPLLRHRYADDD